MVRLAALTASVLAALALAPMAGAAIYRVTSGGTDTGNCTGSPCATIQYALDQHRAAPSATDVISIGPGTFVENVLADDPADDGLTIRGTLSGSARQTTIRADGSGTNDCNEFPCAVVLGASPSTAVSLEDINVDTVGADIDVTPIEAAGGSDLTNVHAESQSGGAALEIVSIVDETSVIDNSTIVATDTFDTEGVFMTAGGTIRDSHVVTDEAPAIDQCDCADALIVTRTWLEVSPAFSGPILIGVGDLTLDSSLLTGGLAGAFYTGDLASTWTVRNTTIDVAQPGAYDSALPDILLGTGGTDPIDLVIDSSILVEEIQTGAVGPDPAQGSITCTYTDFQLVLADPALTVDCATGSDGNTTTDPAKQFVGGSPFKWFLKAAAPAIDTGDPGPLAAGQSTTDLAGEDRVQLGLFGSCPTPIVDKGAYERAEIPCKPTSVVLPKVKSAPEQGIKLASYRGEWTGAPTSFRIQFVRCDADGTSNCTSITAYTDTGRYVPIAADVGHRLRVRAFATNAFGDSVPALSAPSAVVTGHVPVNVQAPLVKTAVPHVGVKATSYAGSWTNEPTTKLVQWVRCNADGVTNCTNITAYRSSGAYAPVSADRGHRLKMRVKATNATGDGIALSAPSGVVT